MSRQSEIRRLLFPQMNYWILDIDEIELADIFKGEGEGFEAGMYKVLGQRDFLFWFQNLGQHCTKGQRVGSLCQHLRECTG